MVTASDNPRLPRHMEFYHSSCGDPTTFGLVPSPDTSPFRIVPCNRAFCELSAATQGHRLSPPTRRFGVSTKSRSLRGVVLHVFTAASHWKQRLDSLSSRGCCTDTNYKRVHIFSLSLVCNTHTCVSQRPATPTMARPPMVGVTGSPL